MNRAPCLIIFTRYPEPGKTKTRLIPAVGAEKAAEIARKLSEHTLTQIRTLQNFTKIQIHFVGGNRLLMQQWLGNDLDYFEQSQGDLGERIKCALEMAFANNMANVIIIGTDCPSLSPEIITEAYEALTEYDLVLGPALDGGYYLIGLNHLIPELFQNIKWSTEEVLLQTLAIAQQLKLRVYQLSILADVDRPEDLKICQLYNIMFLGKI